MEKRYNGKCPGCKKPKSVLATKRKHTVFDVPRQGWVAEFETVEGEVFRSSRYDVSKIWIGKSACCGRAMYLKPVLGKVVADKKCDARCLGAKGHVCECSCGGKNHGASFG